MTDLVRKTAKEKTESELGVDTLKDPTLMDDVLATKLGRKIYYEGTDFSLVGTPAGWTTSIAEFIPYQMQDGTWRLKFNMSATWTTPGASFAPTIPGVVFRGNSSSVRQSILATEGAAATTADAAVHTSSIGFGFESVQSSVRLYGDVAIDSKPTWAI